MGLVRVPVGELRVSVTAEAAHWLAVERERERGVSNLQREGWRLVCTRWMCVCVGDVSLSMFDCDREQRLA